MNDNIPDGFVAWPGGENPATGKVVEFVTRCCVGCHHRGGADDRYWKHSGGDGDIIAYRVTN